MISTSKFRELLGSIGEKMTEEELLNLMNIEYQLADTFIEQWSKEKSMVDKSTDEYNGGNHSDLHQYNYHGNNKLQ